MSLAPPYIAPAQFDDPAAALAQVRTIYDGSVQHLRNALQAFVAGDDSRGRVRACYPFVRVHTDTVARADSRLSYGFVAGLPVFSPPRRALWRRRRPTSAWQSRGSRAAP